MDVDLPPQLEDFVHAQVRTGTVVEYDLVGAHVEARDAKHRSFVCDLQGKPLAAGAGSVSVGGTSVSVATGTGVGDRLYFASKDKLQAVQTRLLQLSEPIPVGGPISDIAVTPSGETVFAGQFSNTIAFGNFMLMTANSDVFITRITPGATPVQEWAIKLGGTASEQVEGLHVDDRGTVSAVAYWTGMTDVAGTPLTAQDYDAWVGSFVR